MPSPFSRIHRGQAVALFTEHPGSFAEALKEGKIPLPESSRLALVSWHRLPPVQRQGPMLLQALAELAHAAWPHWYGLPMQGTPSFDVFRQALAARPAEEKNVNLFWLEAACALRSEGRLPLPRGWADDLALQQVALLLDPASLAICLFASDTLYVTPEVLRAFAGRAEHVAERTGARVAVLLPERLAGLPAFDHITEDAFFWPPRARNAPPPASMGEEHPQALLLPLRGKPHQKSAAEKTLAAALARDHRLASRFACNQPLVTSRGARYVADLLWAEGRVVVEVDGFDTHGSRESFRLDRQRDYELLADGYLVLRIPDEEIFADCEKVLHKIGEIMALRMQADNGVEG